MKSADRGAQTFLYAAMEAQWGRGEGGYFLKECRRVEWARKDIDDEDLQKKLWASSEKTIELLEKEGAKRRALEKKEKEKSEAKTTAKANNGDAKQRKGK